MEEKRKQRRKKENGSKKLISLRKQIIGICFWFCVITGVAWFVILFANIRSYQNEQDEIRLKRLEEYAEILDDSIIQLNEVLGNIFETNEAFKELSLNPGAAEEVDCIHSLLNIFKIQVNSNKNLSGIFLFYDNMESGQYYVNENMDFGTKEDLKRAGIAVGTSSDMANVNYGSTMYVQATEKETYYNVFYKRTGAAIAGSVSLDVGLTEKLENGATYGVIYHNAFHKLAGENESLSPVALETLQPGKNWVDGAVVYVHKLGITNMKAVEILPNTPWLYMHGFHVILGILGVIFIFLAVRINQLVTFEMTRPLEDMNNALSKIQTGVWEVHFEEENRLEEIENVRHAVETMLAEIEQFKIRSYEEQLEKQETELQYLQLQLAPHFYTNCLKNAYYMLMLKEYDNVEKYLLCLSNHLRYLLQKDMKVVELRRERDFVLNYIELQRQMTERSIMLDMIIDEEALNVEVPILFIQTFVENSIKYGMETEQADLKIQVRIRCRKMEYGDCLDVTISDNGPGYPEDVLLELNQGGISQEQKFGIGVINLQHRMKIYYGENVNWYFYNAPGACSDLIVPVNGGR